MSLTVFRMSGEIDFPHLMLRGKAIKNWNKKVTFRDKILSSTDMLGKRFFLDQLFLLLLIFLITIKYLELALEKFGVHRLAKLPKFVAKTAQQLKLLIRWQTRNTKLRFLPLVTITIMNLE